MQDPYYNYKGQNILSKLICPVAFSWGWFLFKHFYYMVSGWIGFCATFFMLPVALIVSFSALKGNFQFYNYGFYAYIVYFGAFSLIYFIYAMILFGHKEEDQYTGVMEKLQDNFPGVNNLNVLVGILLITLIIPESFLGVVLYCYKNIFFERAGKVSKRGIMPEDTLDPAEPEETNI